MTSDALISLRDRINETKTRYNTLQEEINSKLNECSECMNTIEKLHREAGKLTIDLEEQLTNALNDEKEWEEIKTKLETPSMKGMVILNVGGVKYSTKADTLTTEKNTFFTALFSKQWTLERDDADKSVFIDRNGKLFYYILEYLRTGKVLKDVMKNEILHQSILIEAEYFRLHGLINKLILFSDETLLEFEHKIKINEFYGKSDQHWELIYKASRDGFDANAFHTRCDNQGPTMTIIRSSNNYLFGAYTAVPWTSEGGSYKNDTTAFLFTLTNPHNIPPTKYLINPGSAGNAVYHHNGYGPTFGSHALLISNNSNSSGSSFAFPNVYIDSTGKGANTFTGSSSFTTSDIEVFKLA